MPDDDVRERRAHGTQADGGREGEVIHEDGVGTHALDDTDRPPGHELRPPQEIDGAGLRLEAQGVEHASARGREEGLQRTSLGAGALSGPGGARVGPAGHDELDVLEPGSCHDRGDGRPGGHHDPLASPGPGPRDGEQRGGVRDVVGADDQQRHAARPSPTVRAVVLAPAAMR